MPKGLVRTRTSPVLALLLVSISLGWAKPVTQSPYLGVGSAIVWPPLTTAPDSDTLLYPPAKISCIIDVSKQDGKHNRFIAIAGSPPIA